MNSELHSASDRNEIASSFMIVEQARNDHQSGSGRIAICNPPMASACSFDYRWRGNRTAMLC
jgi:hypothetical protein